MKTYRVTVTGLYFRRFTIKAMDDSEAWSRARMEVDKDMRRQRYEDYSKINVKLEELMHLNR